MYSKFTSEELIMVNYKMLRLYKHLKFCLSEVYHSQMFAQLTRISYVSCHVFTLLWCHMSVVCVCVCGV